ncbi:hypothetical protein KY332_00645 [Candidatus Woesearchaeota archaeon]|nr:hypothetical protein [Candidatus Woesearchaeota archaeon]
MSEGIKKIIKKYDAEILKPEIDDEQVRHKLLDGLENILVDADLRPIFRPGTKLYPDIKKFDDERNKGKGPKLATRVCGCLSQVNIRTYDDLINYLREHKFRGVTKLRNFGRNSFEFLKDYLESKNVDWSEFYH